MAKSHECKLEFIRLRAKETPYAEISKILGVSKPTLIDWNKLFRKQIAGLKQMEYEKLLHEYHQTHLRRLKRNCKILEKIDNEIMTRDLSDMPSDKLLQLRMVYHEKIGKEIPNYQVRELPFDIPDDIEFFNSSNTANHDSENQPSHGAPEVPSSNFNQKESANLEGGIAPQEAKPAIDADESDTIPLSNEKQTENRVKDLTTIQEKKIKAMCDLFKYETNLKNSPSYMLDKLLDHKVQDEILLKALSPLLVNNLTPMFGGISTNADQNSLEKAAKEGNKPAYGSPEKSKSGSRISSASPQNCSFRNSLPKEMYELFSQISSVLELDSDLDKLSPQEMNHLTTVFNKVTHNESHNTRGQNTESNQKLEKEVEELLSGNREKSRQNSQSSVNPVMNSNLNDHSSGESNLLFSLLKSLGSERSQKMNITDVDSVNKAGNLKGEVEEPSMLAAS